MGSWKTLWDFARRIWSWWLSTILVLVSAVGILSVQVLDVPASWVVASLVGVLLLASYRLFVHQDVTTTRVQIPPWWS
jgi:hypothetical protein